MALQAKAIKQKMKGVGNIKKITRTMEMVSVSKMKKATQAAIMVKDYSTRLVKILDSISAQTERDHLYFTGVGSKQLIVIISSNKGLAGSYNTNLYKKILLYCKEQNLEPTTLEAMTIGKQSERIAKRMGINIVASFIEITDIPKMTEAEELNSFTGELWKSGQYKKIVIASTKFIKQASYQAEVENFLPLLPTTDVPQTREILFEPSQKVMLDQIIPRLLLMRVYSFLASAAASEHSSRMFAMKTASDNAGELQKSLTISYNKARQDAVTQELAEIAAAVSVA